MLSSPSPLSSAASAFTPGIVMKKGLTSPGPLQRNVPSAQAQSQFLARKGSTDMAAGGRTNVRPPLRPVVENAPPQGGGLTKKVTDGPKAQATLTLPEFGIPLTDVCVRYNAIRGIPFVVFDSINFLINKGLDTPGLFSPDVKQQDIVTYIRNGFELGIGLEEQEGVTILAAAETLRQFLTELPDSLLPSSQTSAWLSVLGMSDKQAKIYEAKKLATMQLPDAHRATLQYFITFLHLLSKHSAQNKLSPTQMSQIFGPLVLRAGPSGPAVSTSPSTESVSTSGSSSSTNVAVGLTPENQQQVFLFLLAEYLSLFPPPEEPTTEEVLKPLYGAPLEEVMQRQKLTHPKLDIPFFVHDCLVKLKNDPSSFNETGLFRLSGDMEIVKRLKSEINAGKHPDFSLINRDDAASLIKAYVRELPQSLFTTQLAEEWMQCEEITEQDKL
jgi:hypothetical protein